jgi:hypothetical protein
LSLVGGVGIQQGGEYRRPFAHQRPRTPAEPQGHAPPAPSSPIHDIYVTANSSSGGNPLKTESVLGGGGAGAAGRSGSSWLKRVVYEMEAMLIGMPAMASNVAREVVRLLKSSKALESETTANLVVNIWMGLGRKRRLLCGLGLSIGKTRRGSLSFDARYVTKVAASGRLLDTIA